MSCPLCGAAASALRRSTLAAVVADRYPVAAGHLLVLPLRHCGRLVDLDDEERADLWALVHDTLDAPPPVVGEADGWTVGVNDGAAAGQVIDHVHVHLIPRRAGDVSDPRGGVRWVLGAKAPWWDDVGVDDASRHR
ncbi:HIT domain-containing protein [Acidimicrobium ferrooxidans]|uniref:HIT domain-containing protein n=1 Tax=Acidimicrobium ferrooxidans TaxID=53635 RepID=UPI000674285E|nr:HIT domain-containing protein [Acidimicrobium ferrooxidans]